MKIEVALPDMQAYFYPFLEVVMDKMYEFEKLYFVEL